MTPSQLDLARRLAERLRGKWRPGMLHAFVGPDGELEDFTLVVGVDDRPAHGRVPVLDDGPTKGAMLAMLRDKTREAAVFVLPLCGRLADGSWGPIVGWEVLRVPCDSVAPTEGESLALALLEVL